MTETTMANWLSNALIALLGVAAVGLWTMALWRVGRMPAGWPRLKRTAGLLFPFMFVAICVLGIELEFRNNYAVAGTGLPMLLAVWLWLQWRVQRELALTPWQRWWQPLGVAFVMVYGIIGLLALLWGLGYHFILAPHPTGIFDRVAQADPAGEQELRAMFVIAAHTEVARDNWQSLAHATYADTLDYDTAMALLKPLAGTVADFQQWLERATPCAEYADANADYEHSRQQLLVMEDAMSLDLRCRLAEKDYAAADRIAAAQFNGARRLARVQAGWRVQSQVLQLKGMGMAREWLKTTRGTQVDAPLLRQALLAMLTDRHDGWYEYCAAEYRKARTITATVEKNGFPLLHSDAYHAYLEEYWLRQLALREVPYREGLALRQRWANAPPRGFWQCPDLMTMQVGTVMTEGLTSPLIYWARAEAMGGLLLKLFALREAERRGIDPYAWWQALPAPQRDNELTGEEIAIDWSRREARLDCLTVAREPGDGRAVIVSIHGEPIAF